MMKNIASIVCFVGLFFHATLNAQVGIGTVLPDDSSILDITAVDKGILVPRVSLANVTTTMLDGINTAATGLLIWNTNIATTGGDGIGFYVFTGAFWEKISTENINANNGLTLAGNEIVLGGTLNQILIYLVLATLMYRIMVLLIFRLTITETVILVVKLLSRKMLFQEQELLVYLM